MHDCSRLMYIIYLIISTRYQETGSQETNSSILSIGQTNSSSTSVSRQISSVITESSQQNSSLITESPSTTSNIKQETPSVTPVDRLISVSDIKTSYTLSASEVQTSLKTSVSESSTHDKNLTINGGVTDISTQKKYLTNKPDTQIETDSGPIIGVSIFAVFGWALALVLIANFLIKRKQKMSKRKNTAQLTYEGLLHRADGSAYNSSIQTTTNPDLYDSVTAPSVYVNSSYS